MAFLEVITRTCNRPKLLAKNQASLARQTDPDFRQTILVDDVGRGIGWAQAQLADYAHQLTGEYIWLLDDDDMCIRDTLVEELKAIVGFKERGHDTSCPYKYDVVMIRMDHRERGVLPDEDAWGRFVFQNRVGCSAYVVRREVWQKHAAAFRSARYQSDFDFIESVFLDPDVTVYWHKVVASRVQSIGMGVPG